MGEPKPARDVPMRDDIRSLLGKVMTFTRPEMEAVVYDDDMPVIVRRFAECVLQGDVREMSLILDQALGKPVERRMEVSKRVSSLEFMSEEEVRALLALAELEEGEEDDKA